MACWLIKSEPGCFSIDDLAASPGGVTAWDGVRNFQARNYLRDGMQPGDPVLFYHSVVNPGVAGLAEVVREAYPDHTAQDPDSGHFDPRARPERPLWYMVDVRFVAKFPRPVSLAALRCVPELAGLELLRKGSRLSVMPVTGQEYAVIRAMGLAGD
ncbi:EVE domain-containing protein [Solidesulfovibrio sp.]